MISLGLVEAGGQESHGQTSSVYYLTRCDQFIPVLAALPVVPIFPVGTSKILRDIEKDQVLRNQV